MFLVCGICVLLCTSENMGNDMYMNIYDYIYTYDFIFHLFHSIRATYFSLASFEIDAAGDHLVNLKSNLSDTFLILANMI